MNTRITGLAAVAASGAVLLFSSLVPSLAGWPGLCLWRRLTTLPCPLCGLTHGFLAMGHGRILEALSDHFAAPAVYVLTWAVFLLSAVQFVSGKNALSRLDPVRPLGARMLLILVGIAWALNLGGRLLS